jgi:homoserine kinase
MPQKLAVAKAYCSSANLGSGFDVFSLSLEKYSDVVNVELSKRPGIFIKTTGPFGNGVPNVVAKNSAGPPALELMKRAGAESGLKITIVKNVPPGMGLGSSGATAAACSKALDDLLGMNLSNNELVRVASLGEAAASGTSHMDNVAASIAGGFIIVYNRDPPRVLSVTPPSHLRVVVVIPKVRVPRGKTKLARKLIPDRMEVSKATLNIGRASVLTFGFARGDVSLIGQGMRDEIAEPYREKLIPGYRAVKGSGLTAGASGVAISGAGPSVIALVDRTKQDPRLVAKAMTQEFAANGITASFFITKPSSGARIIRRA